MAGKRTFVPPPRKFKAPGQYCAADFALLHTTEHGVEGGARKDNRASRGEGQRGIERKLDSTAAGTARAACLHCVSGRRAAIFELWRQAVTGDEL
jgi:hypothetical protein